MFLHGTGKMGAPMGIGEICRKDVAVAYKPMVLSEAARVMRDRHVGCLVVVEETDRGRIPIGMLTDRDITVAVVACDLDARNITVGEVMNTNPATVREEDTLVDALRLMRRRGVRRLPVVTREGVLAGIVTLDDLLTSAARELGELAAAIRTEQAEEMRARPQ